MLNNAKQATLAAYSTYDLPSVTDLIRYFHTAVEYPVRSTWLKTIGAGNYSSRPGPTLANATKYCTYAKATIMGHLVQKIQGVRSTNHKPHPKSSPEVPMPQVWPNKLFIEVKSISKLYTDDTGRFLIHAHSGSQYVMIAYRWYTNLILAVPFKTIKDTHRLI